MTSCRSCTRSWWGCSDDCSTTRRSSSSSVRKANNVPTARPNTWYPDRGRLRQLIIDRLYQDDAGAWHVIDYKTGADQSLTRDKWARQLASYATVVQEAEGGTIAEAVILQAGSAQLIDPDS